MPRANRPHTVQICSTVRTVRLGFCRRPVHSSSATLSHYGLGIPALNSRNQNIPKRTFWGCKCFACQPKEGDFPISQQQSHEISPRPTIRPELLASQTLCAHRQRRTRCIRSSALHALAPKTPGAQYTP